MSNDLCIVSQITYLEDGICDQGDETKVARFEKKISEWQRDVLDRKGTLPTSNQATKQEIAGAISKLENSFGGYWCEGEECKCKRTHWVIHDSKSNCWQCMHDPCACNPPLVWDAKESAYYRFFLLSDGLTKRNIWMSEPTSDLEVVSFRRKEKKRKDREQREKEEKQCHRDQKTAQKEGFCCHEHGKRMKLEIGEEKKKKEKQVNGPEHCIHCDEDPCAFVQIESQLGENDTIYYNEDDYAKDPVAYNSGRRKRAYQYAAFLLWEGINYRRPHYSCVEAGVRALFPPLDGKVMGYKKC